MPVITMNWFSFMAPPTISTQNSLSAFTLILQRMRTLRQTLRMNSHKWHAGLTEKNIWCTMRCTFQHPPPCRKTPSFFDTWTQAVDVKAPNPSKCAHWCNLYQVWCYTMYLHSITFCCSISTSEYSKAQVEATSTSIHIPFSKVSVFHHLKFISYDVYSLNPLDEIVVDSIHTDPVHFDKYGNVVPGRFDTAVVRVKESDGGASLNLKGKFFMFSPLQYFSVPHWFLQDSKDSWGFLRIPEESSGLHYNLSDFELEENNSVKSSGILRTSVRRSSP